MTLLDRRAVDGETMCLCLLVLWRSLLHVDRLFINGQVYFVEPLTVIIYHGNISFKFQCTAQMGLKIATVAEENSVVKEM